MYLNYAELQRRIDARTDQMVKKAADELIQSESEGFSALANDFAAAYDYNSKSAQSVNPYEPKSPELEYNYDDENPSRVGSDNEEPSSPQPPPVNTEADVILTKQTMDPVDEETFSKRKPIVPVKSSLINKKGKKNRNKEKGKEKIDVSQPTTETIVAATTKSPSSRTDNDDETKDLDNKNGPRKRSTFQRASMAATSLINSSEIVKDDAIPDEKGSPDKDITERVTKNIGKGRVACLSYFTAFIHRIMPYYHYWHFMFVVYIQLKLLAIPELNKFTDYRVPIGKRLEYKYIKLPKVATQLNDLFKATEKKKSRIAKIIAKSERVGKANPKTEQVKRAAVRSVEPFVISANEFDVDYPRLTIPKWYYWFTASFYAVLATFFSLFIILLFIIPMSVYINGMNSSSIFTPVSLGAPIEPQYMRDFISDFSTTAPTSRKHLDNIWVTQHSYEDADSEKEKKAYYKILMDAAKTNDNDSIPDSMQLNTLKEWNIARENSMTMEQMINRVYDRSGDLYTNGGSNYKDGYGSSHSKTYTPLVAPPIVPRSKLLCDFDGQYNRAATNIIIASGCLDTNRVILDFEYKNPIAQCKYFNDPETRLVAEKRGREHVGALEKARRECEKEVSRRLEEYRHNPSSVDCACSAHYGMTNLWAYSSTKMEESLFVSDYEFAPIKYTRKTSLDEPNAVGKGGTTSNKAASLLKGDSSTTAPRIIKNSNNVKQNKYHDGVDDEIEYGDDVLLHMTDNTIEEHGESLLARTDRAFWDVIGESQRYPHPSRYFYINGYFLPNSSVLRSYYGEEDGPSYNAMINAISIAADVNKQDPADLPTGISGTILQTLNKLGRTVYKKVDPDLLTDDALRTLFDKREAISAIRRKEKGTALKDVEEKRRRSEKGDGITITENPSLFQMVQSAGGYIFNYHVEPQHEIEMRRIENDSRYNEPELEYIQRYRVNAPDTHCLVKCKVMHDIMTSMRQEKYETVTGLPSTQTCKHRTDFGSSGRQTTKTSCHSPSYTFFEEV